jgi:hypothetical protein
MRHVGTVRLAARNEALVRRGALLLEDALRTASLPEAGPGRVLLFRTLRVGTIHGHMPSSSLALMIERQVRQLAGSVVHAENVSAPARDAVFFWDDAEPSAALAERLARGASVTAWFWPLAVPGFHLALPRDEALRLTLFTALRTSAGPAAAVRLVEGLHTRGGLDALLSALRWQEGLELVRAFGGSPPAAHPLSEAGSSGVDVEVSPALRTTVAEWAKIWGSSDARAIWLSAVVLIIERRGRLADARLFERAARLTAQLASKTARALVKSQRHEEAFSPPSAPVQEVSSTTHAPHEEAPPALTPKARGTSASTEAPPVPGEVSRGLPTDGAPLSAPAHLSDLRTSERGPKAAPVTPAAGPGPSAEPTRAPEPHLPQQDNTAFKLSQERAFESSEWPTLPRPTVLGGLFFLVPVLERIGMAKLLEENPSLLELDAAERLLALIAERVGAPETDPSRVILGTLPVLKNEQAIEPVLRDLLTKVRRWCRRQARIGLYTLVRRPARISATRTHVDVVLDIQQADLRVRRAGLDVNPGWVPWLGRVVRFHYLYGES